MAFTKSHAFTAAGMAAALVAAPMSATAADTDPSTGNVTITKFDDRYADGLFDTTKTAPSGDQDRLGEGTINLIDANGTRHYNSGTNGIFAFEDIPVGPAVAYISYPNGPGGEVLFDATGATSAADITRLVPGNYMGAAGQLPLQVDADGETRLVGMSALRLVANVQYADGTPATGVEVELGSDEWYPATEYDFRPGTYEAFQPAGYIRHLPGNLSVRVQAPEGYRVSKVTAGDNTQFSVKKKKGVYSFSSTEVWNYFWNPAFTVTLKRVPDTTKPVATLVSPTTAGPFRQVSLEVDATDDRGLERIVANIYQDGTLVKSTQTKVNGATAGNHSATVDLPDGSYTVKYNAQDLAGNIAKTGTSAFTIDTLAPTVTVKEGERYTAPGERISFKLYDAGKVAKVEINGVVKDLTDNVWSDVNFVKPGTFGAKKGENTIVVFDVAGNTTERTFTLN